MVTAQPRRRVPVRADRRQPREQRPERQHQRLLRLPAQPAARRRGHLRPAVVRRRPAGRPARPVRHDLPGAAVPRRRPGPTRPGRRATTGPPRPSTAPGPTTSPGSSSAHTSPASRSASVHLRDRRRPAPTAAQQARRPRPARPRAPLPAHPPARRRATGCATVPAGSFDADCVADSDGDDERRAPARSSRPSGRAAQEQRTVNTADTEAGYFATASASNQNPAYGFLDVEATADDLTARFVPVDGGTFTDSFVIHRGDAAAERPADRGVHLDDQRPHGDLRRARVQRPRGPARLATRGTSATARPRQRRPAVAHLRRRRATYQVTLTVTDGAGATGPVTQPVTVTDPPPGPVDFVVDDFGRTVANGLGTADTGGAWSITGTAANFAVNNGSGAITSPSRRADPLGLARCHHPDGHRPAAHPVAGQGADRQRRLPRRRRAPGEHQQRVPRPHGHGEHRSDHRPADAR